MASFKKFKVFEGKVFATSDTHLHHGNIIKSCKRPFLCPKDFRFYVNNGCDWHDHNDYKISQESIDLMDDEIIRQINITVGPDDTLFHLGDYVNPYLKDYYAKAKEFRERINCRNVHLIYGNHDSEEIADLFKSTHERLEIKVNNHIFVLSHYAMFTWYASHYGQSICLFGHSHGNLKEIRDTSGKILNAIDVGVDSAYDITGKYRPLSVNEIVKIMDV